MTVMNAFADGAAAGPCQCLVLCSAPGWYRDVRVLCVRSDAHGLPATASLCRQPHLQHDISHWLAMRTQVAFFPRPRPALQLPISPPMSTDTRCAHTRPALQRLSFLGRTKWSHSLNGLNRCVLTDPRPVGSLASVYRGALICRVRCQGGARPEANHCAFICQPALH